MALTNKRTQEDSFVDFLAQLRESIGEAGSTVGAGLEQARENIKELPRAAGRLPGQIIDQLAARADVVGVDTLRGIADLAALFQSGSERASEEETVARMGRFQDFVSNLPLVGPLEEAGEAARFRLGLPPKGEELLPDILLGLPTPGRPLQRFSAMFRNRVTGQMKKLDDIGPDEIEDFSERVVIDTSTGEDVTEEVLGTTRTASEAGEGLEFRGSDIPELEATQPAVGRGAQIESSSGLDELPDTGVEAGLPPEPRGVPQAGFGPAEQTFQAAEDVRVVNIGEDPITGQRVSDVVTNRATQRLSQQEAIVDAVTPADRVRGLEEVATDLNQTMDEQYISQGRPVWEMTRDTRETISDLTTLGQYSRAARLADGHGIQAAERLGYVTTRGTTVDDLADVIARDIEESASPFTDVDDLQSTMDLVNDLSIGPETTGRTIRALDERITLLRDRQISFTEDLNDLGDTVADRDRRTLVREGIEDLEETMSGLRQAKATLTANQEIFETAFGGLASVENATTAATISVSPGLEALHALHDSRAFANLIDTAAFATEGRGAVAFLRSLRSPFIINYNRARLQDRLSGLSREGQQTVKRVLEKLKQTDRLAASTVPVRRALQAVRRILSAGEDVQ
jgi:hypothetical protein